MERFRKDITELLEEGQELTGAERFLANIVIDEFEEKYKQATGEEPTTSPGIIYLVAPLLEAFGFKLPTVERWRQEDVKVINNYTKKSNALGTRRKP